ncbi:3-keto-disaccharide hydrolase [Larkinella sp. GY13]|uniref:3-keto-disaccharide hydrolase n=1 Tax=Larkinella sp. GY13 TaxID=3453720 RepID=UPI003EE846A6
MKNLLVFCSAVLLLGACSKSSMTASKSASSPKAEKGWISLFDGKTFDGWKVGKNADSFKIEDGAIAVNGPVGHLFYMGPVNDHNFKNFQFKAKVMTLPGSNSGMYFHTQYQEASWPKKGFEVQVNNSHTDWRRTASLYAIQDVKETYVKDNEWYTEEIMVQGKKVTIKINDKVVNEYTEPEGVDRPKDMADRKIGSGTFALQAHDPKSKVYYKDIMVKVLPD